MTPGYVEFEFDLPDALLTNLVAVLESMESASLIVENVSQVPEAQGIYQLFLGDSLVYIGKTDAQAGLRRRLARHARAITHRSNLTTSDVRFKAVRIFVFTAIDLETQLIGHYGGTSAVPWNGSGFGANDPGRNRDMTVLNANGFDAKYPIDIDHPLPVDLKSEMPAVAALRAIASAAPYTVRIQGNRSGGTHLAAKVKLPPPPHTMRTLMREIVRQLPPGWQGTKLPARVILYREHQDSYPGGEVIARS